MEKVRVIVEMRDGGCDAIYAGSFVEVLIIYQDDLKDDPAMVPRIRTADAWTPQAEAWWRRAEASGEVPD